MNITVVKYMEWEEEEEINERWGGGRDMEKDRGGEEQREEHLEEDKMKRIKF